MSITIDTQILELLSSKICHDLISPIGAVNNGVEFMAEMGADAGDEATSLISFSAQAASAKLQLFRMAYGAGGADASIKPEEVHKAVEKLVTPDGKISQVWNPHGDLGYGDDRPDAYAKLLSCALMLAMDCLPRGGELDVKAGQGGSVIIASGENAALKEHMAEALIGTLDPALLSPKLIHAYVSGLLARQYGFTMSTGHCADNIVMLHLQFPAM